MQRIHRALILAVLFLGGCANFSDQFPSISTNLGGIYTPPQPWERDILALDKMQIGGNPVEAGTDDHIYFSKEGSSIGHNIGGGGCGCN